MELKKIYVNVKKILNLTLTTIQATNIKSLHLNKSIAYKENVSKFIHKYMIDLKQGNINGVNYIYNLLYTFKLFKFIDQNDDITVSKIEKAMFDCNTKYGIFLLHDTGILLRDIWYIYKIGKQITTFYDKINKYGNVYKKKVKIINDLLKIERPKHRINYIAKILTRNKESSIMTKKNLISYNIKNTNTSTTKFYNWLIKLLDNDFLKIESNNYKKSTIDKYQIICEKYDKKIDGVRKTVGTMLKNIVDVNENLDDDIDYKKTIADETTDILDIIMDKCDTLDIDLLNKNERTPITLMQNTKELKKIQAVMAKKYTKPKDKIKAIDMVNTLLPELNKLCNNNSTKDTNNVYQTELSKFVTEFTTKLTPELKKIRKTVKSGKTYIPNENNFKKMFQNKEILKNFKNNPQLKNFNINSLLGKL